MSTWQEIYLGRELLTKDGRKATSEVLKNKSRVGIFFSAHWVRFSSCCRILPSLYLFSRFNTLVWTLPKLYTGFGCFL